MMNNKINNKEDRNGKRYFKRAVDVLAISSVIAELIILPLWGVVSAGELPTTERSLPLLLFVVNGPISIASTFWIGFRNRKRTEQFLKRHPNVNLRKIIFWIIVGLLFVKFLSFVLKN